jgi:DNA topoisomerase IA
MRNLLIVESAGKIKKLKSILGSDWDVKASIGHIRQLANDGDGSLGFELGTNTITYGRLRQRLSLHPPRRQSQTDNRWTNCH